MDEGATTFTRSPVTSPQATARFVCPHAIDCGGGYETEITVLGGVSRDRCKRLPALRLRGLAGAPGQKTDTYLLSATMI
jgi:hypothetical protein